MDENISNTVEFKWDAYENTEQNIRFLQSSLNKTAVRSLAEDVLRHVSYRAHETVAVLEHKPSEEAIDELCKALIDENDNKSLELITKFQNNNIPLQKIYICYLAIAAKRLGDWWDKDIISLGDVTIGTSRICAIINSFEVQKPFTNKNKKALFAVPPEETHIIGVKMAANIFREKGWDISLMVGFSHKELLDEFIASDYRIIGLSASSLKSIEALAKISLAIRIYEPKSFILISGNVVDQSEDLVKAMCPDFYTNDVQMAVNVMENYILN